MRISIYFLSSALVSVLTGFNAYAAEQSICHADTNVLLYDNGSLKACQLEKNYDANDIPCKSNNPVSFYDNGNLELCVLSKQTDIDKNTCKEDSMISFYLDGKLKSCVKPSNERMISGG
jgi:antitoxin component YwqK of YwqJK toxin-antitoxin module